VLSLWRVVRFGVAGAGSLGLDLLFQWLLLRVAGMPFWLGSGLSYELGLLGHFALMHYWVFARQQGRQQQAGRRAMARRLGQFQLMALTAMAITWAVSNGLVYGPTAGFFQEGAGPYAAKVLGTGAAMCWTFVSSFFWIWRPENP
jgi:putative flippase GtrA